MRSNTLIQNFGGRLWRVGLLLSAATATVAGCGSSFDGANVQIDFAPTIPAQDPIGAPLLNGKVPNNAHFRIYAIKEYYDEAGGVDATDMFEVQRFEIQPAVDLSSPCLVESDPRSPYRGLHLLQFGNRVANDTGIDDIANPPPEATEKDRAAAATARLRVDRARATATGLKAVTSASTAKYPAIGTLCEDQPGFDDKLIPPPQCSEDAINKIRFARCQEFWTANPGYYEANDLILTAPNGGESFGLVVGTNPANSSPTGASSMFVNAVLSDFEAFAIHWQYDDADGDGVPDYPASVPDSQKSVTGTQYMYGKPQEFTRGVRKVRLRSITNSAISASMAIFPDLGEDNVHF